MLYRYIYLFTSSLLSRRVPLGSGGGYEPSEKVLALPPGAGGGQRNPVSKPSPPTTRLRSLLACDGHAESLIKGRCTAASICTVNAVRTAVTNGVDCRHEGKGDEPRYTPVAFGYHVGGELGPGL